MSRKSKVLLIVISIWIAQGCRAADVDRGPFTVSTEDCPFVARFWIESDPTPMIPSTVFYSLEVEPGKSRFDSSFYDNDWRLVAKVEAARLLSDSVLVWPGPHIPGSSIEGSITFIPVSAGGGSLTIREEGTQRYYGIRLWLSWCLGVKGELLYLGTGPAHMAECAPDFSRYFTDDSIQIHGTTNEGDSSGIDFDLAIIPPFRIGDTSLVRFDLVPRQSLKGDFTANLRTEGFDWVDTPTIRRSSPYSSDTILIEFNATPMKIRALSEMIIRLSGSSTQQSQPFDQFIHVNAVFDDDGTLYGIRPQSGGFAGKVPNSFPRYSVDEHRRTIRLQIEK